MEANLMALPMDKPLVAARVVYNEYVYKIIRYYLTLYSGPAILRNTGEWRVLGCAYPEIQAVVSLLLQGEGQGGKITVVPIVGTTIHKKTDNIKITRSEAVT
jgi:hypothetical protein